MPYKEKTLKNNKGKTIYVDMNNLKSIKKAEKYKSYLENKGHNFRSIERIGLIDKYKIKYD